MSSSSANLLPLALQSFALGFQEEGFEMLLKLRTESISSYRSYGSRSDLNNVSRAELERLKKLSVHVSAGRQALDAKQWQNALDELEAASALSSLPAKSGSSSSAKAPLLPLIPQDKRLRYIRTLALYLFGRLDEAAEYAGNSSEEKRMQLLISKVSQARHSRSMMQIVPLASAAAEEATTLLTAHPTNRRLRAEGYERRAAQYLVLDRWSDAISDANSCIAVHDQDDTDGSISALRPYHLRAFLLQAEAHLALDNLTPAIQLLKHAQDNDIFTKEEKLHLIAELDKADKRKAAREKEREKERAKEREKEKLSKATPPKDYFAILGVSRTSTFADVTALYKKLCLIYHPDKGGNDVKMKEINEAYDAVKKVLS